MSRETFLELQVLKSENNLRLDKFLKQRYPEWGRSAIKKLVNARKIKINGKSVWLGSWELKTNDQIKIASIPKSKPKGYQEFDPAWIIAEDDDLIVVNKPAGLRSHASRAGGTDNLLDLARSRWSGVSLFHRLDRDTSGITLLTKNTEINKYLDQTFKNLMVGKTYLAVTGTTVKLDHTGVINSRIGDHPKRKDMRAVVEKGGQRAVTKYKVLAEGAGKRLLAVEIETGRMHQIRVHLDSIGAPIIGDVLYGGGKSEGKRMLLHAVKLTLPASDEFEKREFICGPSDGFYRQLSKDLVTSIKQFLS